MLARCALSCRYKDNPVADLPHTLYRKMAQKQNTVHRFLSYCE